MNNKNKHTLPPNKINNQQPAGAKKPLIIAAISLGAVIILSLLIFFGQQFVGKAGYTGESNTAGIPQIEPVNANTPFTVTIKANILPGRGTETVAVGFTLVIPPGLQVIAHQSLLNWTPENGAVSTNFDYNDNKFVFEYATLNTNLSKTGKFDIANITFLAASPDTYNLNFASFDIIDLNNHQPIQLTIYNTSVKVAAAAPSTEICTNGLDDDSDKLIDCQDPDCNNMDCHQAGAVNSAICIKNVCKELDCHDGFNNDGDNSSLPSFPSVQPSPSLQSPSLQRQTALTDCQDPDCAGQTGPQGLTCCNGQSVDFQTDNNNCGSCGHVCQLGGTTCQNGMCTSSPLPTPCTDSDGDGYGLGTGCQGPDCNDTNPSIWKTVYQDSDGDNYGNPAVTSCTGIQSPMGYVNNSDDCDDTNPNINICPSGKTCQNNACVISETIEGTKINLTEIAPAGNLFSTKITATDNFPRTEITAYTILRSREGKTLAIKQEKVPGMQTNQTYIISVNYPLSNSVQVKEVYVQDKLPHQGWTVHAALTKEY